MEKKKNCDRKQMRGEGRGRGEGASLSIKAIPTQYPPLQWSLCENGGIATGSTYNGQHHGVLRGVHRLPSEQVTLLRLTNSTSGRHVHALEHSVCTQTRRSTSSRTGSFGTFPPRSHVTGHSKSCVNMLGMFYATM